MSPKLWVGPALFVFMAGAALAQQRVDARHAFVAGDIVSFGAGAYPPGATYRVTTCDPVDKPYRECRMIRRTPDAETHERPFTMENYVGHIELIGHEDPGPAPAAQVVSVPARPAAAARPISTPTPTATPAAVGGACPRSPYGGPVLGARAASQALFEQKITDSITMAAYGPFWYGVKLSNVRVGARIVNSVSVRPGVGAVRVNTGAPVNAAMYPVSATMSVCDGAPAGSSSWRTSERKFLCFVSASNEWTCGASS